MESHTELMRPCESPPHRSSADQPNKPRCCHAENVSNMTRKFTSFTVELARHLENFVSPKVIRRDVHILFSSRLVAGTHRDAGILKASISHGHNFQGKLELQEVSLVPGEVGSASRSRRTDPEKLRLVSDHICRLSWGLAETPDSSTLHQSPLNGRRLRNGGDGASPSSRNSSGCYTRTGEKKITI